ncbi:hypothetical protein CRYUN_Cryun05aG0222900 [Craigia yunnanensis]
MKQWQAVLFPLFLTSLMYAGSLMLKSMLLVNKWKEHRNQDGRSLLDCIKSNLLSFPGQMLFLASNVLFWRNFVVAPLTEELVFRACMIPLLLCGGFKVYHVIFLCPTFFSLAHLNHMTEIYSRHNYSLLKASMVVGLQLGYTVIFGSYASFLFIRTGNLVAPLVAHAFCNYMGLPVLFVQRKGAKQMFRRNLPANFLTNQNGSGLCLCSSLHLYKWITIQIVDCFANNLLSLSGNFIS